MKLAARFPVTPYKPLLMLLLIIHIFLLCLSVYLFGLNWQQLLILPSLVCSFYFSVKQYKNLTQASDDLCWNGQSWLMQSENLSTSAKFMPVIYLKVSADSWLTKHLCLLHFSSEKENFSWLFSRLELGERLYSHLVYLVRQDLKQSSKPQKNIKNS